VEIGRGGGKRRVKKKLLREFHQTPAENNKRGKISTTRGGQIKGKGEQGGEKFILVL